MSIELRYDYRKLCKYSETLLKKSGVESNIASTDFNMSSIVSGSGDILNLQDLLIGESAGGGNLVQYLHIAFNSTTNTTIIEVNTAGEFAIGSQAETITCAENFTSANSDVASAVNQQIVLSGVNLTTFGTTDAQILNNLVSQQKLIAY